MDTHTGLLGSARRVLAAVLDIAHTRLQLASTELEEERLRLTELMLWAALALFFLFVGVVLTALLVVVLLWDDHRELALALLSAGFLGSAALAGFIGMRKARSRPPLFAATLAELKRDREALRGDKT